MISRNGFARDPNAASIRSYSEPPAASPAVPATLAAAIDAAKAGSAAPPLSALAKPLPAIAIPAKAVPATAKIFLIIARPTGSPRFSALRISAAAKAAVATPDALLMTL